MMNRQRPQKYSPEWLSSVLREQNEAFQRIDLGIKRDLLSEISVALDSPMILIITGLRRVGKSTLLAQIARSFLADSYYFVNFEDDRLLNFSVDQFDRLHEALIGLYGDRSTFLFDEIQNVPGWERFVRRLHDLGYRIIITGSNSSLLDQEFGTKLTGRSIRFEVFPFSFREFSRFKGVELPTLANLTTRERGGLSKLSQEYLSSGGIPDALKYPDINFHKTLYDDVIYRDIAARYSIDNVKSLQELAFYLVSNPAAEVSFNKLKSHLMLGSVNTVKKYIAYLEDSWLFFTVNKYAYSVKEQQIAAKKIYGIDTGLLKTVGFSFSENSGKALENLAFLHLRRKGNEIFYYKTNQNHEVDFYVPSQRLAIQVSHNLGNQDTKDREVRSLVELASEQKERVKLQVITMSENEKFTLDGKTVEVLPIYEWLLS